MSKNHEKIQPLSASFFSNLVKLETDFVNKHYTAETLDELVEYYSQAVEYYDSIKDQIAAYFIYKIQDTLAQKKSLKLLIHEKNVKTSTTPRGHTPKGGQVKDFFAAQRNPSSGPNSAASTDGGLSSPEKPKKRVSFMATIIKESMKEVNSEPEEVSPEIPEGSDADEDEDDVFDLEDEEDGLSMAEKAMRSKNRRATHRKSIATLKKKTQKLFTLQMKLQNEKASVKQTLNVLLATFAQTNSNNDNIVAMNIATQRRTYRQRLDAKLQHLRRKSFNEGDSETHSSGSTIYIEGNSPNMGPGLLACAAH